MQRKYRAMASKEVEMRELNDEQTTDEELEISHVVPPDGGYGWVIMFAAFMCNVVVDGIIFTFGLVVTSLSESMDVSVSTAAWVASLLTGFYLLAGKITTKSIQDTFIHDTSRTISLENSIGRNQSL